MIPGLHIKRTDSSDKDFLQLVSLLDHELWNELNEDQAQYDQYNKVPGLSTVVVLYIQEEPVAIGCFKKYDPRTVEIKRMFVSKKHRGKGLSKIVLDELEKWATELGFKTAILETSIHFKTARSLYGQAGYAVVPNYDQYAGLEESVCMKKNLEGPEPMKDWTTVEHFNFEEDFVADGIRCIPMIVRFKLDNAGIKLKLSEWAKFNDEEKLALALYACETKEEFVLYHDTIEEWVKKYTGERATSLVIEPDPAWAPGKPMPEELFTKARALGSALDDEQWKDLTVLQRFSLLKLCKPGHENRNFPIALKEFGLMK